MVSQCVPAILKIWLYFSTVILAIDFTQKIFWLLIQVVEQQKSLITKLVKMVKVKNERFFSERELTLTFAICHHTSVGRLSSVTFVCPTPAIEIFSNVSMPFGTLTTN